MTCATALCKTWNIDQSEVSPAATAKPTPLLISSAGGVLPCPLGLPHRPSPLYSLCRSWYYESTCDRVSHPHCKLRLISLCFSFQLALCLLILFARAERKQRHGWNANEFMWLYIRFPAKWGRGGSCKWIIGKTVLWFLLLLLFCHS